MNAQLVSNELKKLKAFELKFTGVKYEEISRQLDCPVSTLTTYFSRDWKDDYLLYSRQRLIEIRQDSSQRLSKLANKAISVIEKQLDHNNPNISYRAARDILDRFVGRIQSKDINEDYDPIHSILENYSAIP